MIGRRALLLALAAAPLARAAALPPPAADGVVEVAPGLFVLPGVHEEASAANLDAIANTGFIIGEAAVAVVDPGGSHAHGLRLRQAIEARSQVPIRHLVLTHVHPDHVMGAAAFADLRPEVIGHAKLPEALAQRAGFYESMLLREMGASAAGSAPLAPTRLVENRLALDLGGRVLECRAHPPAHAAADLTLLDRTSRTLWLSDLLFVERIPSLDGDLLGWLRELAALRLEPASRAVPGHGPAAVPWPEAAAPLERYLTALRDDTRAAIAAGIGLAEAPAHVATTEAAEWLLAELYHGRNVTVAYRQLEWE
ncbi:MAG: quinoprotein relay system zinc metallohydrolase 2 [Acetobacteraceae bacterium]|nr:quinoprotein relay system zinc metallohydrolase 2 [Acetobacteraceae bacterium]